MKDKKLTLGASLALVVLLILAGGLFLGVTAAGAQGPGNDPTTTLTAPAGGPLRAALGALIRRAVQRGPFTITAINGTTLTVERGGPTRQVNTDAATKFTRAGQPISLADLKVGDRVRIRGKNQNGVILATEVDVVLPRTDGTVKAIDGANITLTRDNLSGTIITTSATVFQRGQDKITLAGLKVGDRIAVEGMPNPDGSFTAARVVAQLPAVGGVVKSVSGSNIRVERDYLHATIVTNSATQFFRGGKPIRLSDIVAGDRVHAVGTPNGDGTFTATRVDVGLERLLGTIKSISGNTLTIQSPGGTRTVLVTADTQYRSNGKAISLADLKTGQRVAVEGTLNADGSVTALIVRVAAALKNS